MKRKTEVTGMTDTEKREKVIRGLEWCIKLDGNGCSLECPYLAGKSPCPNAMLRDALALLREQEPRVMDSEEVARLTEEIYQWLWIEEIQNITWNLHCLRAFVHSKHPDTKHPDTGEFYILANGYRDIVKLEGDEYGKTWRCWTSRPTEEQRKAVMWDG